METRTLNTIVLGIVKDISWSSAGRPGPETGLSSVDTILCEIVNTLNPQS